MVQKNIGIFKPGDESLLQEYTTTPYKHPRSILDFSRETSTFHSTQKPVALFEYLIKTYTNQGDIVLDNCMGGFTTAVACENTKRNWIGFELMEEYCIQGKQRINKNIERLGFHRYLEKLNDLSFVREMNNPFPFLKLGCRLGFL